MVRAGRRCCRCSPLLPSTFRKDHGVHGEHGGFLGPCSLAELEFDFGLGRAIQRICIRARRKLSFRSSMRKFTAILVSLLVLSLGACDKPEQQRVASNPSSPRVQPAATIEFQIDDPENKADDPSPYVHLDKPDEDLKRMRDRDQIVFTGTELTLILDYPLRDELRFTITASRPNGFTRAELAKKISEVYQRVYQEEAATTKVAVIPPNERKGLQNRNETNGKYGIWGHDLSDLVLHTVEISREPDGKAVASLGIDS